MSIFRARACCHTGVRRSASLYGYKEHPQLCVAEDFRYHFKLMTTPYQTGVAPQELARDEEAGLSRWKPFFWIAAAYNCSAAAVALLAPEFHVEQFFAPGTVFEGPVAHVYTQAFWVSVLSFGLGYAIVARDPGRNHGILLLAAFGKTYVFFAFVGAWLAGSMRTFALVGGIGDLIFAAGFVWFLWRVNICRGRGWAG